MKRHVDKDVGDALTKQNATYKLKLILPDCLSDDNL